MPMKSKSPNILSFRFHVQSEGGTFFETPGSFPTSFYFPVYVLTTGNVDLTTILVFLL